MALAAATTAQRLATRRLPIRCRLLCSTLLGSSVHCAQCHDHRYDPISHVDYFALRAVFEPALDWQAWKPPASRLVSLYTEQDRVDAAKIESQVKEVAAERASKQTAFIQEVFEQELLKFEEPLRIAVTDRL